MRSPSNSSYTGDVVKKAEHSVKDHGDGSPVKAIGQSRVLCLEYVLAYLSHGYPPPQFKHPFILKTGLSLYHMV